MQVLSNGSCVLRRQFSWKVVPAMERRTSSGAGSGMAGMAAGRHTNLKFGMAAPYQSDDIWAVNSQENH